MAASRPLHILLSKGTKTPLPSAATGSWTRSCSHDNPFSQALPHGGQRRGRRCCVFQNKIIGTRTLTKLCAKREIDELDP